MTRMLPRLLTLAGMLAGLVTALGCAVVPARAAGPDLPRRGVLGAALDADGGAVKVRAVVPGSAAAAAGLAPGDVVRAVGGTRPATPAEVVQTIRATPAGTRVPIIVVRDGAERTLIATLGAPPNENDPAVATEYDAVTVRGTLRRTLLDVPRDARGPRPAVLLIGGIGCYSVDVASDPDDSYLRITRDLAKAGFITMRLEKSGVGDSQGPPCHDVDFDDESASYAVALDALRRDPRVDAARVYLLGHSIGSVIAPRLALERPVAGIIVSEAVGRDWFEYEIANLRRQLELGGDAPDVVDRSIRRKERCMYRLLLAREPEAQIERDIPECKISNGIYPVAAPYVQEVAALNVIEPWTKVGVPVLAIYGGADYVVAPEDHRRIAGVVNAVHAGSATVREIVAMNHGLRVAATPAAAYDAARSGTALPYQAAFSETVTGWLCARERCTR